MLTNAVKNDAKVDVKKVGVTAEELSEPSTPFSEVLKGAKKDAKPLASGSTQTPEASLKSLLKTAGMNEEAPEALGKATKGAKASTALSTIDLLDKKTSSTDELAMTSNKTLGKKDVKADANPLSSLLQENKEDANIQAQASKKKVESRKLSLEEMKQIVETPVKNSAQVVKEAEKSPLFSLLEGNDPKKKDTDFINTDFVENLPTNDAKQIVAILAGEAKKDLTKRLNEELTKTDDKGKKIEPRLPKTLGGLMDLAKKQGIEIKEFSIEDLPNTSGKQEALKTLELHASSRAKLEQSKQDKVKVEYEASLLKTAMEASTAATATKAVVDNTATQQVASTNLASAMQNLKKVDEKAASADALSSMSEGAESLEAAQESDAMQSAVTQNKQLASALTGEKLLEEEAREAQEEARAQELESEHVNQKSAVKNEEGLEVKINEAKALVRNFASGLREAVENYKPPFTKINMKLNPEKFGEVEVSLVQRGNNVHINISSNPSALGVLMQQSNELKAQLTSAGLNDATMNFNQQQKEQQQQQQHSTQELLQGLQDEIDETFVSSLDLVVPRYI